MVYEIPGIRNLSLIVYSAYQVVSLMSRRPRIRELQRTGTYSVARWRRDGLLAPRGFEDTSTLFDETILKKECKNNRPVARPARFPLQVGRGGRQRRGSVGDATAAWQHGKSHLSFLLLPLPVPLPPPLRPSAPSPALSKPNFVFPGGGGEGERARASVPRRRRPPLPPLPPPVWQRETKPN